MIIRRMKTSDVAFAYECTRLEGWLSETKEVFKAFIDYNAGSCFVAAHDGKRIGTCIATKYEHNGFIGELIILEAMRGKGFGKRLFKHSIEYLQTNGIDNIFLDGELDAVPFYEKLGFRRVCKSLRFLGVLEGEESSVVRKTSHEDIDSICEIDRALFGDDREFFLKRRLSLYPDLFFLLERGHQIRGYITAQPGNDVISVGPWASRDSVHEAGMLLKHLAYSVKDIPLRIGVLEANSDAVELITSFHSLDEKEACWRMAMGSSDRLGMSNDLYAIGAPAKG